jgi:hypothetical protein
VAQSMAETYASELDVLPLPQRLERLVHSSIRRVSTPTSASRDEV